MTEAFLIGGARTPVGRYGGALSSVRPDDLAALMIRAAVERADIDPGTVDEVVLGNANGAGEENRNVARMAWLLAGYPDRVPGITVNRLCASGLSAIITASHMVKADAADVIVAGGVESMSRAPWVMEKPTTAFAKPGALVDTSIGWRFANPAFLTGEQSRAGKACATLQSGRRLASCQRLRMDALPACGQRHSRARAALPSTSATAPVEASASRLPGHEQAPEITVWTAIRTFRRRGPACAPPPITDGPRRELGALGPGDAYARGLSALVEARLRATSGSRSSCPPTRPRRPTSTRMSRTSRPYWLAARSACRRKLEYTPA